MTNEQLFKIVEQLVRKRFDEDVQITDCQPVTGGCIHTTQIIQTSCGRRWFVKSTNDGSGQPFYREADGLQALAESSIRVPEVIGVESLPGVGSVMVLEAIQTGRPADGFAKRLGRQLAEMHRQRQTERFGWEQSNFLGHTPQPNDWNSDWGAFWRESRLGYQLELAQQNGYADRKMRSLGEKLMNRLPGLVATDEPPCLVHGDLWSGNYLADEAGQPVLIDPAVYYADRMVEFGMTTLFGGFGPSFYAAYREVWPWPDDAEVRIELYRLYHLLNHLNLFGTSYRSGCLEILRKYA